MNKRAFHEGFVQRWMVLEKAADDAAEFAAPQGGGPQALPQFGQEGWNPMMDVQRSQPQQYSQEELREASRSADWGRAQHRWRTEIDPNRDAASGTRVWGALSALSKLGPKPVSEAYRLSSLGGKGYEASQKSWQGLSGNEEREENNRLWMRNHRNPGLGNAFDTAAHSLSNSPTIMGSYLGGAAQGLYSAVDRAVGQPSADPIPEANFPPGYTEAMTAEREALAAERQDLAQRAQRMRETPLEGFGGERELGGFTPQQLRAISPGQGAAQVARLPIPVTPTSPASAR
jgi:hypothetical protein